MSVKSSQEMVLDRPSTKVSNPPGGKSSFTLGGGAIEDPPKRTGRARSGQGQMAESVSTASVPAAPAPAQAPVAQQQPQQQPKQTAQQQLAESQPTAHQVKTSVRVSNPPGGKSSIVFG